MGFVCGTCYKYDFPHLSLKKIEGIDIGNTHIPVLFQFQITFFNHKFILIVILYFLYCVFFLIILTLY